MPGWARTVTNRKGNWRGQREPVRGPLRNRSVILCIHDGDKDEIRVSDGLQKETSKVFTRNKVLLLKTSFRGSFRNFAQLLENEGKSPSRLRPGWRGSRKQADMVLRMPRVLEFLRGPRSRTLRCGRCQYNSESSMGARKRQCCAFLRRNMLFPGTPEGK